jgi:hypothetical protein
MNHVCAFFNTIDEEHRVLGTFYKDGIDRGEKAAHIVEAEKREDPDQGLENRQRPI